MSDDIFITLRVIYLNAKKKKVSYNFKNSLTG